MFDSLNRKLTGASFTIFMCSEEFGEEEFTYGTLEEAQEGLKRLKEICFEHYKEDGIERTLSLCLYEEVESIDIPDDCDEDEDEDEEEKTLFER
mgnify:CR=1 FL=1